MIVSPSFHVVGSYAMFDYLTFFKDRCAHLSSADHSRFSRGCHSPMTFAEMNALRLLGISSGQEVRVRLRWLVSASLRYLGTRHTGVGVPLAIALLHLAHCAIQGTTGSRGSQYAVASCDVLLILACVIGVGLIVADDVDHAAPDIQAGDDSGTGCQFVGSTPPISYRPGWLRNSLISSSGQ